MHFLIVYRRSRGEMLLFLTFFDSDVAAVARLNCEFAHANDGDVEVVVLSAESEEQIRRTHGRYFKTFGELATDIGKAIP